MNNRREVEIARVSATQAYNHGLIGTPNTRSRPTDDLTGTLAFQEDDDAKKDVSLGEDLSFSQENEVFPPETTLHNSVGYMESRTEPTDAYYKGSCKGSFDMPMTGSFKSWDEDNLCSINNRTPTVYDKMQQQNSYEKESGYGGSKSSTDTDATTPATPDSDMLFDNGSDLTQGRIKSLGKVHHDTISTQDLSLETLSEGSEHSDYSGSNSQNSDADYINKSSPSTGHHMPSYQMEKFKSNESVEMTQSVHVNYRGPTHSSHTAKQRCQDLSQLPASLTSSPTWSIDKSRWTEKELNNHLRLFRHEIQERYMHSMTRKGEPPEKIQFIGQQLLSIINDIPSIGCDSPHDSSAEASSLEPFSSISLTDSSVHSNSVTMQDTVKEELLRLESSSYSEDQWPSFDREELLSQLSAAVGCQWRACPNSDCQEGQLLLHHIKRFLECEKTCGNYHTDIVLRTIAEHAELCDELKCPIPWCTFFHENDLYFEEQLVKLRTLYFSGSITLTSEDSETNDVRSVVSSKAGCAEHVDWFGIVHLGSYGNTVLAISADLDNPDYWVIKRERKNLLQHAQVIGKLRRHPRIVQHHWILEQDDYLFFAAKFDGASVAERMCDARQQGLPTDRVCQHLQELISATKVLHKCRVVYLNWTVENVLLSADMKHVKLCNFSSAVLLDECDDEDILEDVKLLLPPRIVPPELYQGEVVREASDVWGLGCLCYQMVTGRMLYDEFRHEHPAAIRDMFEESFPEPDVTDVSDVRLRDITTQCLQVNLADRLTTAVLHEKLINLISSLNAR